MTEGEKREVLSEATDARDEQHLQRARGKDLLEQLWWNYSEKRKEIQTPQVAQD